MLSFIFLSLVEKWGKKQIERLRGKRRKVIKKMKKKKKKNRSPKGDMWSVIPFALLCIIVNWSKGKQASGPEVDKNL